MFSVWILQFRLTGILVYVILPANFIKFYLQAAG